MGGMSQKENFNSPELFFAFQFSGARLSEDFQGFGNPCFLPKVLHVCGDIVGFCQFAGRIQFFPNPSFAGRRQQCDDGIGRKILLQKRLVIN